MVSLIQERMAIDRAKKSGLFQIVVGAGAILFAGVLALMGSLMISVVGEIVFGAICLVQGLRHFIRALRAEVAFEAEHGENAGTQEPVR